MNNQEHLKLLKFDLESQQKWLEVVKGMGGQALIEITERRIKALQ